MTEPHISEVPGSRWRRRALITVSGGVALLAGALGLFFHFDGLDLRSALETADRLDPDWRFEGIETRRASVPDAGNAALTVQAVIDSMPPFWPSWEYYWMQPEVFSPRDEDLPPPVPLPPPTAHDGPPDFHTAHGAGETLPPRELNPGLDDMSFKAFKQYFPNSFLSISMIGLPAQARLTERQAEPVRRELSRAADALGLARDLARWRQGQLGVTWSEDGSCTTLPPDSDISIVVKILYLDALLRMHEGDPEGAFRSCEAILNVGGLFDDIPSLYCHNRRAHWRSGVCRRLERALAQGAPPADALARLQGRVGEEAEVPISLICGRAERVRLDRYLEAVRDGTIPVTRLQRAIRHPHYAPPKHQGWAEKLESYSLDYSARAVVKTRASVLRRMNALVEILKKPAEKQAEPLKAWQAAVSRDSLAVRTLCDPGNHLAWAGWRDQAEMRCTAAALAVERYRLKHGRWPERLDDLAPTFLKAVPADPFDGKPLRYRHDEQGVVVYSVGADRRDDGGAFDTLNTHKDGTDLGFRLWELARRGRPQP